MNQILMTKLKPQKRLNSNFFKFQFSISILILFILLVSIFSFIFSIKEKEKIASQVMGNYQIFKLYSNINSENSKTQEQETIFGTLEIPKINLNYPIFSSYDNEKLKISLCKFYGTSPSKNGNICIAGHNYNNYMFFSQLSSLNVDDEIFLYDSSSNLYVYRIYEVLEYDLSPIFNYSPSHKELTLVTCDNLNSKRLIVKARQYDK